MQTQYKAKSNRQKQYKAKTIQRKINRQKQYKAKTENNIKQQKKKPIQS